LAAVVCLEEVDVDDARMLRAQLELGSDVNALLETAKPLNDALLFHVLSCWDVEFCAGYFGNTMQAYPLFQLVMPRFDPSINFDHETGRFSKMASNLEKGYSTLRPRVCLISYLCLQPGGVTDVLPENMPG